MAERDCTKPRVTTWQQFGRDEGQRWRLPSSPTLAPAPPMSGSVLVRKPLNPGTSEVERSHREDHFLDARSRRPDGPDPAGSRPGPLGHRVLGLTTLLNKELWARRGRARALVLGPYSSCPRCSYLCLPVLLTWAGRLVRGDAAQSVAHRLAARARALVAARAAGCCARSEADRRRATVRPGERFPDPESREHQEVDVGRTLEHMFDALPVETSSWRASLNPAQLEAVTAGPGPILVIAGAGSGKTWTLACRVAHLIEQGVQPERILLLTFSRRAAREMLSRADRLVGQGRAHRVWGGTFHAVANRWLRLFGRPLGLAPDFTVLDQADSRPDGPGPQ